MYEYFLILKVFEIRDLQPFFFNFTDEIFYILLLLFNPKRIIHKSI